MYNVLKQASGYWPQSHTHSRIEVGWNRNSGQFQYYNNLNYLNNVNLRTVYLSPSHPITHFVCYIFNCTQQVLKLNKFRP